MKILSLNLANYNDHPNWEVRKSMIVDWINLENPDIILFQEDRFDRNQASTSLSYLDMTDQIAQDLELAYSVSTVPAQYYSLDTHDPVDQVTALWEGISTLVRSDHQISESSWIPLPQDLEKDGNRRILTSVSVSSDVKLLNVHFSYDPKLARLQAEAALKWVEHDEGTKIFMGDFNCLSENISDIFQKWGYVDLWKKLHPDEVGYTFPSDHPIKRIDLAFGPDNVGHRLTRVFQNPENGVYASDHLGLCLEF